MIRTVRQYSTSPMEIYYTIAKVSYALEILRRGILSTSANENDIAA